MYEYLIVSLPKKKLLMKEQKSYTYLPFYGNAPVTLSEVSHKKDCF